jgi:hypothetical protein
MFPFPAARYRFEFTVETPIRLPEYAGSALRGAFGNALRRTACMTREKDCKPCPLYRTCPYPAIFETPAPANHALQKFSQIPNPYVVEPPPWGEKLYEPRETLVFHLVLIGQAIKQLPLVVFAWQRAFEHGVGRGQARLEKVWRDNQIVFDAADSELREHTALLPSAPDGPPSGQAVTLRFQTPLRLQHNGKPIGQDELTARNLLVGLIKRTALMTEFHLGQKLDLDFHALAEQAAAVGSKKQLHWRDWTRYSARQKQEMALGGVIGDWTLHGDLAPFHPFLHLGQWLHVGKNATFGLGHYQLL